MPTIKLTDQLGLDVDVQPAPTSALLKYFQQIPWLHLDSLDLSKVGGLTLDQPAIRTLGTGVSLAEPVDIGADSALKVGAGAKASIRIGPDASELPGHDDDFAIPQDTCYVSFEIQATVSADASAASGILKFGASPSSEVDLICCTRFPSNAGITLLEAVKETVSSFTLPATCDDLAGLAAGQIVRAAVSGKLTVWGSANLLAATNPLAAAALPAPLPAVSVAAGGSVTVGASCTIETEFELVARRLDSGAVRLGWYRKKDSAISVSVAASEGITAGIDGTDLFSQLIGVISASPGADLDELKKAGLSADQASSIQTAVARAANRKLEIAVEGVLTAGKSDSTLFVYEIDTTALSAESRDAVNRALRGDLSGLHGGPLAGVSRVRSIWESVRKRELELRVNLLGVFNFRSIASLALSGKVLYEPASGSLVITDQATAQRISTEAVNFGADAAKLRHVLAESFLITAAYRGARQIDNSASLRCSYTSFELQNSTSPSGMAHKLRTGAALGLLDAEEAAVPGTIGNFGRTLFTVSADYSDRLIDRLFLDDNGLPLPLDAFESAGRAAISTLVQPGDQDEVRRRPAMDEVLWQRMKDTGQPGFPGLFPATPAPLVGAITNDYSLIRWWADAMQETAAELAKVRLWIERNPTASLEDPGFQKLREDLAEYLRNVAANTRPDFGDPWALLAMDQLAGHRAPTSFLLSGPVLVRDKHRAAVADRTSGSIG
jgi:hypothetical protein